MGLLRKIIFHLLVLIRILSRHKNIVFSVMILILFSTFLIYKFLLRSGDVFTGYISEGIVGTYTENDLPKAVTNLLSRPLIQMDRNGVAKPDLASGWEVNKEANKYTISLKDNIKWLDEAELKASDFDIKIPDVVVKVLNDKKISLELTDSFSPLPSLLTEPLLKKDSLVGTGPYYVERLDKNQIFVKKIVLKAHQKDLPEVIISFYPNERIAKNALRIGEVSSLIGINDIKDFMNEKPYSAISLVNYSRIVAIFFNTKDAILSDRNFRLALSFGAPSIKKEIEAKTSIPPISWAFNPNVKDFLDNSDQAKIYLSKVKQGKDSTITLTVSAPLKEVGEKVINEWTKQGIKAVMRVESGIPQNFQALLIAQDIPIDPDQYSLWHSTQVKTNVSQYFSTNQYSPRVDKDLEDGRKTTDIEVRKARYQDMQKVLLDDGPATFLYFPKYNLVFVKKAESSLKKIIDLQLSNLNLSLSN